MLLRLTLGAVAGALAWFALHPVLTLLPTPLRFFLAWLIFTSGPGLAVGARLTRGIDPLRRTIVQLGLGSATLPILVEIIGRAGFIHVFPYFVCALGGIGLSMMAREPSRPPALRGDLAACVLITTLALTLGWIVFAHRLVESPQGLQIYGDYDSYDLSHYAAWASDATHTIPPKASFYSGHRLNAAYYPQLVLTMVHRFANVPLLPIYFGYAWPTFLALGSLTAFVAVRQLASTGTALLAVVFLLIGSDFSYLAAWLLPNKTFQWDYVLWPTNFLAPTMEVLHFNTWTPSFVIFFTAIYALVQSVRTASTGWTVVSAFLIAVLFQFKPFAYIVLMAGVCATFVFAGRDWGFRRHLAVLIGLVGLFTIPLIYNVLTLPAEDKRSRLVLDAFVLPERMLIKLGLTGAFSRFASDLAPVTFLQQPIFLLAATALFLAVGPGIRWFGAAGIWRALRGEAVPDGRAWRILAWIVVAGVATPFVLATDPYVDTLQFYQTGLYISWIFAAAALTAFARSHRALGAAAIALALLVSTPSSIHYLARKWTDNQRPALAELSQNELTIADYLRTQDPESTVILHDRPTAPSLIGIAANRRVVLGWGRGYYAVGSQGRVRDINRFFGSARRSPQEAWDVLRRYHVTHVVVRTDRDRVHPDVLAKLTPVMTFPDAMLYHAPPE